MDGLLLGALPNKSASRMCDDFVFFKRFGFYERAKSLAKLLKSIATILPDEQQCIKTRGVVFCTL